MLSWLAVGCSVPLSVIVNDNDYLIKCIIITLCYAITPFTVVCKYLCRLVSLISELRAKMSADFVDVIKKGTVKIKGKRLGVICTSSIVAAADRQGHINSCCLCKCCLSLC